MTLTATVPAVRRVATYERVSSEDKRELETIKTQTDEIAQQLVTQPGVELVSRYVDDGVSGAIPLADRPDGGRLLHDASAGLFEELWVYKFDRLGRNTPDQTAIGRWFRDRGIRLISRLEGEPDLLMWDVLAAISDNERRVFLRRSADGMNRAAREGRYCGGIRALGFRVEGQKQNARLVPDESLMWADLSAAGVVRRIYERIALEGWSCRRVAAELNTLGVPTAYSREGRGVRGMGTQNIWGAGHIRNMVTNPIYKGQLSYGRRTRKRDREVISAPIEGLVSPALWDEAQAALARNRRCAKNTHRVYLLKGVLKCATCGLTYVGSWSKDHGWYRCGGQLVERGPIPGKCLGVSVRTDRVEPVIWADIEAWLRNPGDVLDQLDGAGEREVQGAIAEAEVVTLTRRLETLDSERRTALDLRIRGLIPDAELEEQLDRIKRERATLQARLAAAGAPVSEVVPQEVRDLLSEVRARLDGGLDEAQRQEIVRLLVGIVIQTTVDDDGKKAAKALVTYRFPGVVETRTGTGSSPR